MSLKDILGAVAISAAIIGYTMILPIIILRFDDEPIDTKEQRSNQRAMAEASCDKMYGRDAIFFETKQGHLVCRNARK